MGVEGKGECQRRTNEHVITPEHHFKLLDGNIYAELTHQKFAIGRMENL